MLEVTGHRRFYRPSKPPRAPTEVQEEMPHHTTVPPTLYLRFAVDGWNPKQPPGMYQTL